MSTVRREQAEAFVEELALVFDVRLTPERRSYYADQLLDMPESAAKAAFTLLVRRSKRFPFPAEVLAAFEDVRETTHEVERSRAKSPEQLERERSALAHQERLTPIYRHPDLYDQYLADLRALREGRMSREAFARRRAQLLEQAAGRDAAPPAPVPNEQAPVRAAP